ncbi:MAG: phosphoesterase [Terrimicrobiaceae bacterium]
MSKLDENVLVISRDLFDKLGSFQGFLPSPDNYLTEFLRRGNNSFLARSRAENDPSFKQLIPYSIFTHEGRILHYVRGSHSGEQRLVAKGSIGIGGHINDGDEGITSFDHSAYRKAVAREIHEELVIDGTWADRIVGLINDDSTEVGSVHLGVVHVVRLSSPHVTAGESAISNLEFLDPDTLVKNSDSLETWSQIIIRNWVTIAGEGDQP